jgi:hypothetical protein
MFPKYGFGEQNKNSKENGESSKYEKLGTPYRRETNPQQ